MNEEHTPVVEPITNAQSALDPKPDWKHHFTTVTPLSRALAMLLFIALPFVGFWVGAEWGTSGGTVAKDGLPMSSGEEAGNNGTGRDSFTPEVVNVGTDIEPFQITGAECLLYGGRVVTKGDDSWVRALEPLTHVSDYKCPCVCVDPEQYIQSFFVPFNIHIDVVLGTVQPTVFEWRSRATDDVLLPPTIEDIEGNQLKFSNLTREQAGEIQLRIWEYLEGKSFSQALPNASDGPGGSTLGFENVDGLACLLHSSAGIIALGKVPNETPTQEVTLSCGFPQINVSEAGTNVIKLQRCPDEWVDDQMPGDIDRVYPPRQYYILDGVRREMNEFDPTWVKRNCALEVQVVY